MPNRPLSCQRFLQGAPNLFSIKQNGYSLRSRKICPSKIGPLSLPNHCCYSKNQLSFNANSICSWCPTSNPAFSVKSIVCQSKLISAGCTRLIFFSYDIVFSCKSSKTMSSGCSKPAVPRTQPASRRPPPAWAAVARPPASSHSNKNGSSFFCKSLFLGFLQFSLRFFLYPARARGNKN